LRFQVRPVLRGRLGRFFVGVSLFEAANMAATLMILRATDALDQEHDHDAAVKIAIGLYVVYNVAATVVSVPGGRHGDRRGMVRVFAVGVGCFALAYAGFAMDTSSIALLGGAFAVAGVGIGLVETAEHAAVATLAPETIRGSAFGLLAAVQSFGNLAASAVVGVIYTAVSPEAAFGYAAVVMVIALGAILVTSRSGGPTVRT